MTAAIEIYTRPGCGYCGAAIAAARTGVDFDSSGHLADRKSTRLNSNHVRISYAVFCLKKKHLTCTACGEYFQSVSGRTKENSTLDIKMENQLSTVGYWLGLRMTALTRNFWSLTRQHQN